MQSTCPFGPLDSHVQSDNMCTELSHFKDQTRVSILQVVISIDYNGPATLGVRDQEPRSSYISGVNYGLPPFASHSDPIFVFPQLGLYLQQAGNLSPHVAVTQWVGPLPPPQKLSHSTEQLIAQGPHGERHGPYCSSTPVTNNSPNISSRERMKYDFDIAVGVIQGVASSSSQSNLICNPNSETDTTRIRGTSKTTASFPR